MNLSNPYLREKAKNPYWDDDNERALSREQRRVIAAKHRARRQANFVLGSVLFEAMTGAPPVVSRAKCITGRKLAAARSALPVTLQLETESLL